MPIPMARIHTRGRIFSPFSGLPADSKNGPNRDDPTLLFVYYGESGIYAYISEELRSGLNEDIEYLDVENLHAGIDLDSGLILEVETDVNGINYYGFAPVE